MTDDEKLTLLQKLEDDAWEELRLDTRAGNFNLDVIERCQRIRANLTPMPPDATPRTNPELAWFL